MKMEFPPEDKKVIDLLSKLKTSNGGYPSDMLASRRQQYMRQVANIGLGIGVGAGVKSALKGGGNGAGATATVGGKIVETILVAAIVIEAGAASYLYRAKIADLFRSYTSPNVQQTQPGINSSSQNPQGLESAQASPVASITLLVTPSAGPSLTGSNNSNGANIKVTATPHPNNGNQYGLTPKPERTKENNGGNNNGGDNNNKGGGNNNKP